MAPKRKRRGGRPALKKGLKKTEGLGIRVTPDLRAALDRAAAVSGRSLSAEIAHRLAESLEDDRIYGDPALRELATIMVARFAFDGANAADNDVPASEWMKEQGAFDQGALSVMMGLWERRPENTRESTVLWFEALKSQILTSWFSRGKQ